MSNIRYSEGMFRPPSDKERVERDNLWGVIDKMYCDDPEACCLHTLHWKIKKLLKESPDES